LLKRRCRGGLAVAALVLVAADRLAAEPARTNYELVVEAARRACAQMVGGLRPHLTNPVALRAVTQASGNFLVENALSGVLADSALAVRTRPDSTGAVLEFEVVDLGMTYVDTHRSHWIGTRKVEREARARLFARLIDQGQEQVLWADQAAARAHDEVPVDDLAQLEERNPPDYAKATLPPRKWNKLVEPVVVTGIVVGLIVLFFTNQETK
jgi:hypothetical protein